MASVRFYSNNKRLSTARILKNETFLQVYPEKKYFASEDEWRAHWTAHVTNGIQVMKTTDTSVTKVSRPKPSTSPKVPSPKPSNFGLSKYGLASFDSFTSFLVPAGDYYIGDLCYALKDELYEKVFGGMGYSTGLYKMSDGSFFMMSHTKCGDGEYPGTNGKSYPVDAGIIGIAPLSVCKPVEEWSSGEIHTFPYEVSCVFVNGRFQFTSKTNSFTIKT